MCDFLKEVYYSIYDETFDYSVLDHRIKLQKAVYFLENMGVTVGDYSFSWNKYGPYSLKLDSEAKKCSAEPERTVKFSDRARECFEKIKRFVADCGAYSKKEWVECIASIHYLLYVIRIDASDVVNELIKRKPYLDKEDDNIRAFEIAKTIRIAL